VFLLPNTEKVYQFLSVATQLQVAMLLSKPFTAGLVLITLSTLSQGRVIQPSTQNGQIADPAIRAETLAGTKPDICHFYPDLVSCTEGLGFDIRDSYHWKRAPPRVRPGKHDENTPQDGSSSQTGGGAQEGGGAQTGGKNPNEEETSTQNDDDTPSAPPPAIKPPTDPVAPAAPTVLAAYADVPKDFNVPGRVPGQDVLPNEIPAFRGLSTSAEDAARRASFQRFVNWDIQSSNLIPPGSHYLLFLGDTARASRMTFKNEFNIQRKHTDNLSPNDQGRVVDNSDVYTGIALGDDMVPVPPSMAGAGSVSGDHWLSMLESYGMAKRAAARGGTVRVLVDTNEGTNTVNRNRLFQEGSFFHNFELGVVTGPDTQVQSVLAYGAREVKIPDPVPGNRFQMRQVWTFTPPEQIWSTGQPQIGKTPDWIDGTIPKENREGFREGDDLIDLDDLR
jgi:hypothetical protein